jgi:hypothetical protein
MAARRSRVLMLRVFKQLQAEIYGRRHVNRSVLQKVEPSL